MKSSKRVKREDDDVPNVGPTPEKRPRRSTTFVAPQGGAINQVRICQDLYEILRTHKTNEGRLLCQQFIRAPSRRNLPQYYDVVSSPVDLLKIHQKLKNEEYETVEQLTADVQLMVDNAKAYFSRTSTEFRDACEVWQLYSGAMAKMTENLPLAVEMPPSGESSMSRDNASPSPSTRSLRSNSPAARSNRSKDASPSRLSFSGTDPIDRNILEEFLSSVAQLTDESGRSISDPFKTLPSKTVYPDYYTLIKEPVDLRTIAFRFVEDRYKSVADLERDFILLCKNAKMFNDPSSLIYKDALCIRKYVQAKKSEILDSVMTPISKERQELNERVVRELLRLPSPSASLDEINPEELGEDTEEHEGEVDATNSLWKLYMSVRFCRVDSAPIAEPFCLLPSRKFYPDYYDEIKNPMSLFMIKYRIRNRLYKNLEEMLKDLDLIFENARKYNIDGSPIYESANVLQRTARKAYECLMFGGELTLPADIQYTLTGGDDDYSEEGDEESEDADGDYTSSGPSSVVDTSAVTVAPAVKKRKREKLGPRPIGPDGRPMRDPRGRKSYEELMEQFGGKMGALYNALQELRDVNGRQLIAMFVEKPSRKLYPDYYDVIKQPIDMKTIKQNIESGQYGTSQQLEADVELMFNNARTYNEPNSEIYNDASLLEKHFKAVHQRMGLLQAPAPRKHKYRGTYRKHEPRYLKMGVTSPTATPAPQKVARRMSATPTHGEEKKAAKLAQLYEAVNNHVDTKGRKLAVIFQGLPSKAEYPDYYEVIKKPIDLFRIASRLQANQYESLEALAQDFSLMFDNACKYNDPESHIYKDALTLQRVMLEKKAELRGDEQSACPDVVAAVQELLTTLFITVYNHEVTSLTHGHLRLCTRGGSNQ